ncbi:MAG: MGH1-like glycoside hydrolase domain-containing protein [Phycisphaerales bacterium]
MIDQGVQPVTRSGSAATPDPESARLAADAAREANWKRWGPYLSERQWGTVREDYSEDGNCWDYFTHDQARSRAYRWGEDGLLGICDRQCRMCFALALWNGRDPILKERLFGLTGPQGNHGEDVKEHYFYLDSTPTHSYMRALYKYPHAEYPYARLVSENVSRGKHEPEFELADTGVFDGSRYFDVQAEYAKADQNDILIRITLTNRGPERADLHVLPTLWFRNTWSWGRTEEGCEARPSLRADPKTPGVVLATQASLGEYAWFADPSGGDGPPRMIYTENESNLERLFGSENPSPYVKDAFHELVVHGRESAVNPGLFGTKAAAWYSLALKPGEARTLRLRIRKLDESLRPGEAPRIEEEFDRVFAARRSEADVFFNAKGLSTLEPMRAQIARQGVAGLLWSKQFYHYVQKDWLEGDPSQPKPPRSRKRGRNADWPHLFNRDVISMPDKWEYPWYAAWDLAFHMIPFAHIDPHFAKEQLLLFMREWYMHPNGQLPAYEFALGDVNPPVHAWACWRIYKMTGTRGGRDFNFLARAFQKLMLNFTWWVNRKDLTGKNLFSGGFLGLDNIGVFDRSRPLPTGGLLQQADGTAWMAFYCGTMLSMALELARFDSVYEDVASKFFEHFVAISDAMNTLGGTGLWDEADGFYYDQIWQDEVATRLRVRSLVGIIPMLACEVLEDATIDALPGFKKRMDWFLKYRPDLARHITYMQPDAECGGGPEYAHGHRLLAIPSRERLVGVLRYLLDENEFLSPFGVRSLSRVHERQPFIFASGSEEFRVDYTPGESTTGIFGGNSNWRGPIWFPINFLIVEALERYHFFYGDSLRVECPVGSGRTANLLQAAALIRARLVSLFLPDAAGNRPCLAGDRLFATDPHSRDLVLFHEHFHADTGRGLGATHQTGWTALVVAMLRKSMDAAAHAPESIAARPAAQ